MTLRPATFIYRTYGLPRSQLRELAVQGIVHSESRLSIDGVNRMKLYDVEDVERYLNDGGSSNG